MIGLKCQNEVLEAWKKAKEDDNFGFLKIGIDMDKNEYTLLKNSQKGKDISDTWSLMANELVDKNHSYFVIRDPENSKFFLLVHFGPDLSPVKQRMIYASSRGSLKSLLGGSSFSQDYFITNKKECSNKELINQRNLAKNVDLRSDREIEKEEASFESTAKSTTSSVMQLLPIEMKDKGKNAIDLYKSGKTKTVILHLEKDTQSVDGSEQKVDSIEEIEKLLPEKEPRYIMFNYKEKSIFGYFCPDKADRKLKFTYSTCKQNLIDYCQKIQLEFGGKLEFSSKNDFSREYLDYHLFPKKNEKEQFKKPKPGGRKKKRRGSKGVNKKLLE